MNGTLEFTIIEAIAASFFIGLCAIIYYLGRHPSRPVPALAQVNLVSTSHATVPQLSYQGVADSFDPFPVTFEAPEETVDQDSKIPALLTTSPTTWIPDTGIPLIYRGNRYIRLL